MSSPTCLIIPWNDHPGFHRPTIWPLINSLHEQKTLCSFLWNDTFFALNSCTTLYFIKAYATHKQYLVRVLLHQKIIKLSLTRRYGHSVPRSKIVMLFKVLQFYFPTAYVQKLTEALSWESPLHAILICFKLICECKKCSKALITSQLGILIYMRYHFDEL